MTTTTTLTRTRWSADTWPRAAALAATIGALAFLAGQALLPELPNDLAPAFAGMVEHRDQLLAARLLTAAGCFLLVPAAVGYAGLVRRRDVGGTTLRVGATLLGIGAFSNAVSQVVQGYATHAATGATIDRTAGRAMVDHIASGAAAIPIGFWSIPAFALGCILVSVGLLRSRRVATWVPVVLIIGTVMAGAFAGQGPIVALTQAPATIALIVLAWFVAHTDSDPNSCA